jgi:hypothetical protein
MRLDTAVMQNMADSEAPRRQRPRNQ